MNDKDENSARIAADSLISDLIAKQPELIKTDSLSADGGKLVGDFICALRDRLIEMYQKAPH